MNRARIPAALLSALSGVVMGVSVWSMAGRIAGYYERTGHALFVFREVGGRSFTFAGRGVTVTDEGEGPTTVVSVRYGERELRLPATREPGSAQIPGLARHDGWLKVLRFAERGRMSGAELQRRIEAGEVRDRLVIVVRDPRRWADGRPHGEGQARDSLFIFHELLPDGSIRTERWGFPLSRRDSERAGAGPPPLREDTWQYYAALSLIPSGSRPTPRFTSDAVRAMGWTLPGAAFSGLVLTLSVPWLLSPRSRGERKGPA
jgi:hypothetical protein